MWETSTLDHEHNTGISKEGKVCTSHFHFGLCNCSIYNFPFLCVQSAGTVYSIVGYEFTESLLLFLYKSHMLSIN